MTKTPKTVDTACDGCGKIFARSMKAHKRAIRLGQTKAHCSPTCYRSKPPVLCAHCGNLTTNPKYCSRSCSASVNGSLYPKKKAYRKQRICKRCSQTFTRSVNHCSYYLCPICLKAYKESSISKDMRLAYFYSARCMVGKHPSWKNSEIRRLNRKWNASLLLFPCANCGYDKHVELAHIKAITSFPKTAKIGDVNDLSNVIQLCRNCHWELDHGLLNLVIPARFALA